MAKVKTVVVVVVVPVYSDKSTVMSCVEVRRNVSCRRVFNQALLLNCQRSMFCECCASPSTGEELDSIHKAAPNSCAVAVTLHICAD